MCLKIHLKISVTVSNTLQGGTLQSQNLILLVPLVPILWIFAAMSLNKQLFLVLIYVTIEILTNYLYMF